jgi:hypothetical protein
MISCRTWIDIHVRPTKRNTQPFTHWQIELPHSILYMEIRPRKGWSKCAGVNPPAHGIVRVSGEKGVMEDAVNHSQREVRAQDNLCARS